MEPLGQLVRVFVVCTLLGQVLSWPSTFGSPDHNGIFISDEELKMHLNKEEIFEEESDSIVENVTEQNIQENEDPLASSNAKTLQPVTTPTVNTEESSTDDISELLRTMMIFPTDDDNEIDLENNKSTTTEKNEAPRVVGQGTQTDALSTADIEDITAKAREELLLVLKDSTPQPVGLSINIHVDNMNNYFTQANKTVEGQENEKTNSVGEKRKLYVLEYTKSNWMEATAFCKSNGGALASIRSQEENDQAVESILRSHEPLTQVWIGGLCPDKNKSCFWIDSWEQFSFVSWLYGQPNHLNYDGADEQCVQYKERDSWAWNDDHCFKEFPFICQYNY